MTSQTLFSFCRLALSPRALINVWTLVWIEEIKDENVSSGAYSLEQAKKGGSARKG